MDVDPNTFWDNLKKVCARDAEVLEKKDKEYGSSWKKRGGIGAFMMLCRKWDRIETQLAKVNHSPGKIASGLAERYDIFAHIIIDGRDEGLIDDVRDLRRYLALVEAELVTRGALQVK